jgi:hypothetical protein
MWFDFQRLWVGSKSRTPQGQSRLRKNKRRVSVPARRLHLEALERRELLSGNWALLTNAAPGNVGTMMLLSDGTVMAQQAGVSNNWYSLTPQAPSGSYLDGVWAKRNPMGLTRLFFASNVLPSGKVLVVGGEYTNAATPTKPTFNNTGQIYDPVSNQWSGITNFPQSQFGDDPSAMLPDGRVLTGYINGPATYIFDPANPTATNAWTFAANKLTRSDGSVDQSDEETWVKLPDGSILTYDIYSSTGTFHAERYVPSQNQWVDASNVDVTNPPSILTGGNQGSELGPAFLQPNGKVIYFGANGNTAIYNPATNTWSAGFAEPTRNLTLTRVVDVAGNPAQGIPNQVHYQVSEGGSPISLVATDNPGAMLPNGHILIALSPLGPLNPPADGGGYSFPQATYIYEYDPTATTAAAAWGTPITPAGFLNNVNAFETRMLVLPSGQALLSNDQTSQVLAFTPNEAPNDAWRPAITDIERNAAGTATLTGTQLNGISEGASYGDDAEMSSNFPLVQLQNTPFLGNVYLRTSNWDSTGVATGSLHERVQFALGTGFDVLMKTVANGISSPTVLNIEMAGSGNNFLLRRDPGNAANLQILNNGAVFDSEPFSAFSSVIVTGTDGTANNLTVDYVSGGFFNTPVTFHGGAGTGPNQLTVTDQGDSRSGNWTVTNTGIVGAPSGNSNGSVTYYQTQALDLKCGNGGGTVNVQSTSYHTSLAVEGGGPNTTINVGDAGSSQGIEGKLILSNIGGSSAVTVDDSADPGKRTAIVYTKLVLSVPQTVISGLTPFGDITLLRSLSSLVIRGGIAGNTFRIHDTPYNGFGVPTTVYTGAGNDLVTVDGSSGPLTVNGQSGLDTVNIGSAGSVRNIGNSLTVTNAGGFSAVKVDDSADNGPRTVILYNNGLYNVLSGLTPGGDILLRAGDLSSLMIRAGGGGNTFRIHDTPDDERDDVTTTVLTGTGTDSVTVDGTTGALNLNVQGGANNQSITIGSSNGSLDRIQGAINISGPGGTNYVTIDDRLTTAAQTITHTITATSYTRTGAAPIHLSDVYSFSLWCGSAANTINVQGRPSPQGNQNTFNVLGGTNTDIINVGNAANQLVALGGVNVDGGGGANTVTFYDQGRTTPQGYSLGPLGSVSYFISNEAAVLYSNMGNVSFYGGSGGSSVLVYGTSPAVTTLHTGSGKDVVTVGPSLDGLKGPLSIDGQDGDDRLVVNDSAAASGQTYDILPGSVSRTGAAPITFAAIEHLDVNGTNHDDVFRVGRGPQVPGVPQPNVLEAVVTLTGNGGSDTLTGPDSDTMWSLTGPGSGSLGAVAFSGMSNLVGGAGVDSFTFGPNASIGSLNGGGGGDWLDYSAFTTGVIVNLVTGSATAVAGGAAGAVSNVQDVAGGTGNDQLTGNDQGNILVGRGGNVVLTAGNGRSLLIGGAGNATITGAAGDDIVIGGKTSYDQDHAALAAILADWQRTDETYAQRIEDLDCGDGYNGTSKLRYLVTVQAGGADVLTGSPGQDWFFQFPADTITDLNNGGTEQVENSRLPTGNLGYALQFGADGGYAQGNGITTDAAGNVYTIGQFEGTMNFDPRHGATYLTSQGYVDTYVAKYSPQGNLLWVQQWGGTNTSVDDTAGVFIKVDGVGNVYVDGWFYGSTTIGSFSFTTAADDFNEYDGFIAKLDSTGTVLWARQAASTASGAAALNGFVVDGKGNLFVSGYYQSTVTLGAITLTSAGSHDGLVTKLNSAGTFVWARSLGGSDLDEAYGMSMDASGNLYSCGYFAGTAKFGSLSLTSAGGEDGFLAKLNGSGTFLWVRQLGGSLHDFADSVQVDSAGNVYTAGDLGAPGPFSFAPTMFLAKYTSSGTLLWTDQFNDSANRSASEAVALDSAGGVYLDATFTGTVTFGGTTVTSAGDFDVAVVKLTSAGAVTWVRQFGGTDSDTALGMAVDSSFNVYTTGWFGNTVDADPGPDTCTLTGHPDTFDTFVWQLTQPGAMSYTAPAGSGSASYDLRLNEGYVQLVDSTTNAVLLSKAQVDTTSVSIQAANGVNTTLVIDFSGGSYSVPVTFTGGTGSNTLVGANVANNWTITGANAGAVGNVRFTKVANLVGGTDVDVFAFGSSGTLSGRLDGGGVPAQQGDWLDYSGLTVAVTVNLQTGSATKVGGGAAGRVANIRDVHGGNGGNTLTGNSQGNILIGGTGADTLTGGTGLSLLIGGQGADQITGGSGGDLLIGDSTTYDTMNAANELALMGILAEWQSADSYATRFADINTGTGGGLNGTAELNFGTTVLDDSATDTATAAASAQALDWFFQGAGDTLLNVEAGEHINNI